MINFEEAYNLVRKSVGNLNTVTVGITDSIGAVLAENSVSDIDMPPFNKSAMDGYAVRSEDCASAGSILEVIGEVKAGSSYKGIVGSERAVAIMTGAPVPEGANAVVPVEETEQVLGNKVRIIGSVQTGQHICFKAEDVSKGTEVLKKGTLIRGAEISVLATVGKNRVNVYRRPRVSIIATGDELVDVKELPKDGQIRNSNGPQLLAMLRADGFEAKDLGIIFDKKDALKEAAEKGLENDILVLTGGVSAGKYDFVPEIMESIGVKTVFHKIYMKPGKPVYFGVLENKCVFGMPGNPMSTFLSYQIFVKTALKKMMGIDIGSFHTEKGKIKDSMDLKPDRKKFIPVWAEYVEGVWCLKPVMYHGSADIFALTKSNAFVIVEAGIEKVNKESTLDFFKWQ